MIVIPTYIALIEYPDPAVASKLFENLKDFHSEDLELKSDLPARKLNKKNLDISIKSEDYAESRKELLEYALAKHENSKRKSQYIELIHNISYEYCKLHEGFPPACGTGDVFEIVNRIMWQINRIMWQK